MSRTHPTRYEIFIIKLEIYYARNSRAKPAISSPVASSCSPAFFRRRPASVVSSFISF